MIGADLHTLDPSARKMGCHLTEGTAVQISDTGNRPHDCSDMVGQLKGSRWRSLRCEIVARRDVGGWLVAH